MCRAALAYDPHFMIAFLVMWHRLLSYIAVSLASVVVTADVCCACPLLKHVVDFNCDREIKIVAVGDSIVRGRGDLVNNNNGGWILRLGKLIKAKRAVNMGIPGITSGALLQRLTGYLNKPNGREAKQLRNADIVIVSVGINDFFQDADAGLTVRNIKRIVDLIRRKTESLDGLAPFVVVAKLLPTTRGFQRGYQEDVNTLLARYRSEALPSYLRFDLLDETFISQDGIHPVSEGYDQLAAIAKGLVVGEVRASMLAARPDSDRDGVFDYFERTEFGTDPSRKDSDVDGLSDGKEIFTYGTDPNLPDTDGDGISDGDEVRAGRNPLDPAA